MKTLSRALLLFPLFALLSFAQARTNRVITVTAGTPVRLSPTHQTVDRIFIQMMTGGSGRGFVMDGIPLTVTPDRTNPTHLTAELQAATATSPGGNYADQAQGSSTIDIAMIALDGTQTGDKIIVSYYIRN